MFSFNTTVYHVYLVWPKFHVFIDFLSFADLIFTEDHLEKMKK